MDFDGFALGLNSAIQPHQILPNECAELVNFKINRGGQLQTRPATIAHTDTAVGAIVAHAQCNIGGTNRELIVDTDKILYYNLAGVPTQIGSVTLASNDVQIFPFKGVALICDGSYLKFCDGIGATNLKMAYDDGSGTRGYQSQNLTGTDDSTLSLGNGTITRVAYKFTSQAWDAGYTIPPTTIEAYLTKAGSPTGAVTAKLRLVTGDAAIATGTISLAEILTGTAEKYEVTMTVTTNLAPATPYYMTLEYAGGDGSNYVKVHCTTVASGGLAYTYAGSYSADTTKTPLMGCSPGRPPKCSFGEVHSQRPWLSGDPDNAGYVWYGNLTYLDFSTANGGGFIGSVDSDANNYAVGAIKSFYGELYVFGTANQPYLGKLSGSTPGDWTLPALFQRQSASKDTLVSSVNDLWFADGSGVDALSGVTEYGDLRTYSYSDPVVDRFRDYWTSTALAGYNPTDGQYMLAMPNYHRVLCCHTKAASLIRNNEVRYPWAEYEFTREHLTDGLTFKWNVSSSGTNEFYATAFAGGDPSIISTPDFVLIDGSVLDKGSVLGSLKDHEYQYGDNDGLSFSTVYVRDDSGNPDVTGVDIRTLMVPTSFASFGGDFYLGGSDGLVYKLTQTGYKDNGLYQLRYDLKTQYIQAKYAHVNMVKQQLNIGGKLGVRLSLEIFTDDQFAEATATYQYIFSVRDDLMLKDLDIPLVDAYFMIDPAAYPTFQDMNVNARTFQIRLTDLLLSGEPVFINGASFQLRMLEA